MTTEPMDEFEGRLERALHRYVESAALTVPGVPSPRPARRPFPLQWAAVVVVLLVVVAGGASWLLGTAGSRPAETRVDGRTYHISIARSLMLDASDVTPFAPVDSTEESYLFAEMTAYAVDGVDPDDALVVPAAPGLRDDGGPYGDWILLLRGGTSALCPYFDPSAEATPPECRDAITP